MATVSTAIARAAGVSVALILFAVPAGAQTLEERLQRLEDREAIRALIIEYGRSLDVRDFESFSALFAEHEGEWIGGFGAVKGRDAIRELMEARIGSADGDWRPTSHHLMTNETIDVNGDRANAVTKWVFVVQNDAGRPEWTFLGRYEDTFVRESGEWRFLRRQAITDIPSSR